MRNLHILFLVLLAANSFSQMLTPEFEFQLYFEDAIGNRDTITLGYDTSATDTIDTSFGEVNILNQPWGNDFEVRISDATANFASYRTKKQIVKKQCDEKWSTAWNKRPIIEIKNFQFPIYLRIDREVDSNLCINNSFLYVDGEPWEKIAILKDLNPTSPIVISEPLYQHFNEYTDTDGKIVFFISFIFADNTLSINNFELNNISPFPNPFTNKFSFPMPIEKEKIKIYNLQGENIEFVLQGNDIFLNNSHNGIYILSITTSTGIYNYKIIKN